MRPDMPRWTIRVWPSSSRISMYFARRSMAVTVRPSTFAANLAGSLTRRSLRRWISRAMRWPTMRGTRPRRTVSTSGSSGMDHLVSRPEQCAADADMGGAQPHRRFVVGAHAHADLCEPVARGHLVQQREVQRRLLVDRRDAHQADHRQLVHVAARSDEGVEIGRQDACLLLLFAGIDLDEAGGPLAGPLHLLGQHAREPLAVDRLDDVEQGDRVARLV